MQNTRISQRTAHGSNTVANICALSLAIAKENGERERRLRAKCEWENMTRHRVLSEYGDPAYWKDGCQGHDVPEEVKGGEQ